MDQAPGSGGKKIEDGGANSSILLTEEARGILTQKLEQYKERMAGNIVPKAVQLDSAYKIILVQELLKEGKIDTTVIEKKIRDHYGDDLFDEVKFKNACGVIKSYISDGGKKLHGGQDIDGQQRMTSSDILGRPR